MLFNSLCQILICAYNFGLYEENIVNVTHSSKYYVHNIDKSSEETGNLRHVFRYYTVVNCIYSLNISFAILLKNSSCFIFADFLFHL